MPVTTHDLLDQPTADRPAAEGPHAEIPHADRPHTGRPDTDGPHTDGPGTGRPAPERPDGLHDLTEVRAWARSRGYPIDESAAVPLQVLRTYRRVHGL